MIKNITRSIVFGLSIALSPLCLGTDSADDLVLYSYEKAYIAGKHQCIQERVTESPIEISILQYLDLTKRSPFQYLTRDEAKDLFIQPCQKCEDGPAHITAEEIDQLYAGTAYFDPSKAKRTEKEITPETVVKLKMIQLMWFHRAAERLLDMTDKDSQILFLGRSPLVLKHYLEYLVSSDPTDRNYREVCHLHMSKRPDRENMKGLKGAYQVMLTPQRRDYYHQYMQKAGFKATPKKHLYIVDYLQSGGGVSYFVDKLLVGYYKKYQQVLPNLSVVNMVKFKPQQFAESRERIEKAWDKPFKTADLGLTEERYLEIFGEEFQLEGVFYPPYRWNKEHEFLHNLPAHPALAGMKEQIKAHCEHIKAHREKQKGLTTE